jgi:hypothetical protein
MRTPRCFPSRNISRCSFTVLGHCVILLSAASPRWPPSAARCLRGGSPTERASKATSWLCCSQELVQLKSESGPRGLGFTMPSTLLARLLLCFPEAERRAARAEGYQLANVNLKANADVVQDRGCETGGQGASSTAVRCPITLIAIRGSRRRRARCFLDIYNDGQMLDAFDYVVDGLESASAEGYTDEQWQSIADHPGEHVQNGLTWGPASGPSRRRLGQGMAIPPIAPGRWRRSGRRTPRPRSP